MRDDSGAIFIDRDPTLFGIILNYLRTRDIDIKQCDLRILRHEAEYYNISPLVRRLILCEDLNHSSCGDVWFYAHLTPPGTTMVWMVIFAFVVNHISISVVPGQELNETPSTVQTASAASVAQAPANPNIVHSSNAATSASAIASVGTSANAEANSVQAVPVATSVAHDSSAPVPIAVVPLAAGNARPGSMVRVPEMANGSKTHRQIMLNNFQMTVN